MDIRNDSPIEAVTAPAVPPEVIVIPSYDTPGDVFPGWKPLPPAAPVQDVVPPPVALPAAPPVAVQVEEPELDETIRTFDDRLATGLIAVRYVLFAAIAALGIYGAYSVLSVATASIVTIILAVALIAGIAFFVLRFRGVLAAVGERCDGAVLGELDETDPDATTPAVRPSAAGGRPAGRLASVVRGSPATVATGGALVATASSTTDAPGAPNAAGVEIGQRREFDELTGSWEAWDGKTTPAMPSVAQLAAQEAASAPTAVTGQTRPAFTGEVKALPLHRQLRGERHPIEAPRFGAGAGFGAAALASPVTGLRGMASSVLFGASSSPAVAPGAGVAALSLDAQRAIATGGLVSRTEVYGSSVAGAGVAPEGFLTSMWVAEMRSGRHQQIRGVLRDSALSAEGTGLCGDAMCARGLLYNTAMPSGWFWRKQGQVQGWDHVMRDELNKRYDGVVWQAEHMNDSLGCSWFEIADWVERNARV